jgi:AcrR family transcriptional regulator
MAARSELSPRKRPRQQRSRETVDAILEAGARVFAEQGFARGSTNRIAEAAGVSVGSLYEYFPNKDAILVALAERRLDEMKREVQDELLSASRAQEALPVLLRRFVMAMLEAHEDAPDLHRAVFSETPHPPALHACVLQMEEALAHALEDTLRASPEVSRRDTDTAAHLVVQTVEALTHRFVHHGIHELARGDFADEVVALLLGYLQREPGAVD